MNKWLVYKSKAEAEGFQKKRFSISLKRVSVNNKLIRHSDKKEVRITGMTDVQLNADFVVYGFKAGIRKFDKGFTSKWAEPWKRKDGKWVIQWDKEFDNISGVHVIEEHKDDWF